MIKYNSVDQVSIDDFLIPQGKRLNVKNRWIILAKIIPWDDLSLIYSKTMSKKMGRKGIHPRIIIGAVIIKHLKSLSDEDTIEEIRENPYLQYFLGLAEYTYDQIFTPSLFVTIRRRLGDKAFKALIDQIIKTTEEVIAKQHAKESKSKKGDNDSDANNKNKGHLIVDATVAPSDIKYPTDLDLLSQSREKSEMLIDLLWKAEKGQKKPRTYRRKAKSEYLKISKKRRKSKSELRKAIGKQLRYLGRNLRTIEKMLDNKKRDTFPLVHNHQRLYWIIQELYHQQKEMYDNRQHTTAHRIVSVSQPHVRPIVRGKAGSEVEFGLKLSLSLFEGSCNFHNLSWDAYNESKDLKGQIESYRDRYGYYPEYVSGDQIYGTKENRQYMKSKGIKYSGVSLGRPKQLTDKLKEKKKKRRERVKVEGKFGEAKRKYQLDLIMAKRSDTSISWVGSVILVINIAHLLRVMFFSIYEIVYHYIKMLKIQINDEMISGEFQYLILTI